MRIDVADVVIALPPHLSDDDHISRVVEAGAVSENIKSLTSGNTTLSSMSPRMQGSPAGLMNLPGFAPMSHSLCLRPLC
jgi:hypothetical protein